LERSADETMNFARLFEEFRPRLLATIRRRIAPALSGRIDPEDLLQEVFLRAQVKWPDRESTPKMAYAWLYKIARDCTVDAWRHAYAGNRSIQREVPWPDETSAQLGLGLVGSTTSPSERFRLDELRERVRSALTRLKPEDQEILWMRHADDLAFREVALVLGIAENTAMQRYARALRRFRQIWSEVQPPESRQP
jgi:RNA polymerase sigma-70 factor (ECF subfamily)